MIMMTKQTKLMIILGVNRQVDGKVDGAVEDEEEVGDLGEKVDHIRFQVLNSVAWKKVLGGFVFPSLLHGFWVLNCFCFHDFFNY